MTAVWIIGGIALIFLGYWLAFRKAPTGEEVPGVGFIQGPWHDSGSEEK